MKFLDLLLQESKWDQDPVGKQNFLQTGRYETTRFTCLGISNGQAKKLAATIFREHKEMQIDDVIHELNWLMFTSDVKNTFETHLLGLFVLEKFNRSFSMSYNAVWSFLCKIVDSIDYWAIADHLCINVSGYLPLIKPELLQDINSWVSSKNYWKRRLSMVIFLKPSRMDENLLPYIFENLKQLIHDENYYVRKALPWVIRESYRKLPQHQKFWYQYLTDNITAFSKTEIREASKAMKPDYQDSLIRLYEHKKKS